MTLTVLTRGLVSVLVLAAAIGMVVVDLKASTALNPFKAPPLVALGSGQAASGAHCATPPPIR